MKASLKRTLREGILPLLEMVAVMIVTVLLFRLIRNADGRFVQPSFNVGGDETDPSRGRLIYMIFAFIGSSVFTVYATILSKRSETGRGHGVWLCACAGGLLMWQALGECLWHFGFRNDMGFTNFPRIESAQGWIMMIPFTAFVIYAVVKELLPFGLRAALGVFWANWLRAIATIGTYPLALKKFSAIQWYPIVCLTVGIPLVALSAVGIFGRRSDGEVKHYSAMLFLTSFGMIFYGAVICTV
jgi:hypothetical protein